MILFKKFFFNFLMRVTNLYGCTVNEIVGLYPSESELKNNINIPSNQSFVIDLTRYTDKYYYIVNPSKTSDQFVTHIILE